MVATAQIVPEPPQSVKQPWLTVTSNVINIITHILLGGVAFGAIQFANILVTTSPIKSHIYLCVVGYVLLMAHAMLAINPYNGWLNMLSHRDKKIWHGVIQLVGAGLAMSGSILRISNNDISSFLTAHGSLGFTAMLLAFLTLVCGVLNFYSSALNLNATVIRLCHLFLGCSTIVVALLALIFGFDGLYKLALGDNNAAMMISLTVFAIVGTVFTACTHAVTTLRHN